MEETAFEANYLVKERAEADIKEHGSVDNAIRYLEATLESYEEMWSAYSSECLGHGITCTRLKIDWLKRIELI